MLYSFLSPNRYKHPFFLSGRGGGGGGGGDVPPLNCLEIIVVTTLNSPVPSVLATLHIGDFLDIVLKPQGGNPVVVAQTAGADVAGSITSDVLPSLIRCITDGFRYNARVLEIDGGRCRVQIRPISQK
jgi:hypothetical protein